MGTVKNNNNVHFTLSRWQKQEIWSRSFLPDFKMASQGTFGALIREILHFFQEKQK